MERIDARFFRFPIDGEFVLALAGLHLDAFPVQRFAVAFILFQLGERADFDKVVDRNFGFIALRNRNRRPAMWRWSA